METTKINDLTIEKGTGISIDVLSINHSEKLWGSDPDQFNPDRYVDDSLNHRCCNCTTWSAPRAASGQSETDASI